MQEPRWRCVVQSSRNSFAAGKQHANLRNTRNRGRKTRRECDTSLREDRTMDRPKRTGTVCVVRSGPHWQLPCHLLSCGSPKRIRCEGVFPSWEKQRILSRAICCLRNPFRLAPVRHLPTQYHVETGGRMIPDDPSGGGRPLRAAIRWERSSAGKCSILPGIVIPGNRNTAGSAAGIRKTLRILEKSPLAR